MNRTSDTTVMKAENLGITFGGLHAVSGFDMELREGELVGLIRSEERRVGKEC